MHWRTLPSGGKLDNKQGKGYVNCLFLLLFCLLEYHYPILTVTVTVPGGRRQLIVLLAEAGLRDWGWTGVYFLLRLAPQALR